MTLQIYLSTGTVPTAATEATEEDTLNSNYPWGGFAIPIFDYGTITNKTIYLRHRTTDNPGDPPEDHTFTDAVYYVHSATLSVNGTPFYAFDSATQLYTNTGEQDEVEGWALIGGITDNTQYNYFEVFDQSQVSYLPYQSAYDASYVTNAPFPNVAYDPDGDPPSYPVDTASSALEDPRSSVDVDYTLTVVWSLVSMEDPSPTTTVFDIADTCTQVGDPGTAIRNLLAQSSYVAGYRPLKNPDNDPWTWATDPVSVSFD